jgi:hypothetical protein
MQRAVRRPANSNAELGGTYDDTLCDGYHARERYETMKRAGLRRRRQEVEAKIAERRA